MGARHRSEEPQDFFFCGAVPCVCDTLGLEAYQYAALPCRIRAATRSDRPTDRSTRRPSPWIHYKHLGSLWQAMLSLPSTRSARPRPQSPAHLQSGRQDHLRVVTKSRRYPQGRARSGGVSEVPGDQSRICRNQRRDLSLAASRKGAAIGPGKKTVEAIQKEVTREVDQLLRVVFNAHRKSGRWELEALEMAVRAAMHRAGATALTTLLQFPAPAAGQRDVPCACGHQARYRELRSKPVLTAVGPAETSRPYTYARTAITVNSQPMSNWI
jgi:hypothetical protein